MAETLRNFSKEKAVMSFENSFWSDKESLDEYELPE